MGFRDRERGWVVVRWWWAVVRGAGEARSGCTGAVVVAAATGEADNSSLAKASRLSPPCAASAPSKLGGGLASSGLSRRQRLFSNSRLPMALGCSMSLMPLHSATASALLRSMLSSEVGQWGSLSEGFATPL